MIARASHLLRGWSALAAAGVAALGAAGAAVLHERGPTPAAAAVPACVAPLGGDHVLELAIPLRLHVPRIPPPAHGRRALLIVVPRPGQRGLGPGQDAHDVSVARRRNLMVAFLSRRPRGDELLEVTRSLTGSGACGDPSRVSVVTAPARAAAVARGARRHIRR